MNIKGVIILVACFLILFTSYNDALMTTRYGKKNVNNDVMRPRIMKNVPSFFVGPRYGKRMAWSPGEEHDTSPNPCTTFQDMNCEYTGISNYYRCSFRREEIDEDFAESN